MKLRSVAYSIVACVAVVFALSFVYTGTRGSHRVSVVVPPALVDTDAAASRLILSARWDTVATIELGGAAQDLTGAYQIAAIPNCLAVLSSSRERLFVFRMDHRGQWSTAPNTFGFSRDLKADGNAHFLVVDGRPPVIWRYSAVRASRDSVSGGTGNIAQVVALGDGRIIALSPVMSQPLFEVDHVNPRSTIQISGTLLAQLNPMQRQGLLAADPGSSHWVYALAVADGWVAFDGTQPRAFAGHYIEPTPAPIVVVDSQAGQITSHMGRAVVAAVSITLQDSILSVLFGGRSPVHGRVIDRYQWASGAYLGSYVLPSKAAAIAAVGRNSYAVLTAGSTPQLLVLRSK